MRLRNAYDWLRAHPYVFDTSIALVLLGLAYSVDRPAPTAAAISGLVVGALLVAPLVWRRRFPTAVFTVVSLACLLQLVLDTGPLLGDVGFLIALYSISAYAHGTVRYAALGVGVLGALLADLAWWFDFSLLPRPYFYDPWYEPFIPLLLLLALVGFAWTLGDLLRTRRAYVEQLEERARRLELERDQQAQLARTAERTRIARELHDIVAHSLSIVIAQADGGRYAGAANPAAALSALDTIGATGRDALAEMRRLLGVLRTDNGDVTRAPQPGPDDVEALVARVRDSGVPIEMEINGQPRPLPKGPGLAVYRIVQEALTNVVKHAGPHASCRITLTYGPDSLHVRVVDDGRGAAAAPTDGDGHGIVGMRERVAVYGGTLTAGPARGGGFAVDAVVPMPKG